MRAIMDLFTLTIVGNTGNETLAVIFDDDKLPLNQQVPIEILLLMLIQQVQILMMVTLLQKQLELLCLAKI